MKWQDGLILALCAVWIAALVWASILPALPLVAQLRGNEVAAAWAQAFLSAAAILASSAIAVGVSYWQSRDAMMRELRERQRLHREKRELHISKLTAARIQVANLYAAVKTETETLQKPGCEYYVLSPGTRVGFEQAMTALRAFPLHELSDSRAMLAVSSAIAHGHIVWNYLDRCHDANRELRGEIPDDKRNMMISRLQSAEVEILADIRDIQASIGDTGEDGLPD